MEWYVVYISYESFKAITYMADAFIIYIVLIVEAIGRSKGTTEDWRICFFIVVLTANAIGMSFLNVIVTITKASHPRMRIRYAWCCKPFAEDVPTFKVHVCVEAPNVFVWRINKGFNLFTSKCIHILALVQFTIMEATIHTAKGNMFIEFPLNFNHSGSNSIVFSLVCRSAAQPVTITSGHIKLAMFVHKTSTIHEIIIHEA